MCQPLILILTQVWNHACTWIFCELVKISIGPFIFKKKKKKKSSDNSSSTTALSSTASKAGNMGQHWKYFTWHLTSVETNAKHDLVSSRLAPAGAWIQINGLPSQQMSQENLARKLLTEKKEKRNNPISSWMRDSISVRRFLPIASVWAQLGKCFWEMRSNRHKQTLTYTYARTSKATKYSRVSRQFLPPWAYFFSLILLTPFKTLKGIIHLSEMRMLTRSSFKRFWLHSFDRGGSNSDKQWSGMGGYFIPCLNNMRQVPGNLTDQRENTVSFSSLYLTYRSSIFKQKKKIPF